MFGRHPAILSASGSSASFIRALQPAAWFAADRGITVTGQGVSTWADQSGNGRDLLQGTDDSRPPYLSFSGTKYLYLPGVASNNATSPDSVASSFTGDCEFIARIRMPDWTPSTTLPVIAKRSVDAYQLSIIATTGVLRLNWWDSGGTLKTADSTSAPTVTDGSTLWIRATLDVDNGSGGNDVKFYTAADAETVPTSWTQLGTTVTGAGTTSVRDTAAQLSIGQDAGVTVARADIFRVILKSGIDGTTVVDFNPDLDASDGSTSFASSATGETWTVNSSGGLPAQIVGRPSLLFDGTADFLKTASFSFAQPESIYLVCKPISWTSPDTIFDGEDIGQGGAVYQTGVTPSISLFAGSTAAANTNLVVGSYAVLCAVINGAGSILQINNTTPTTGDAGAQNMGSIRLGNARDGTSFANLQALEMIAFSAAHDATQRARVIQYLAGRHGVAL